MSFKNGDFVKLDFIGREKLTGKIFDLTNKSLAKEEIKIQKELEPIIVPIGSKFFLPKFEESLIGKDINQKYEITLEARDAYGPKNPKLIQLFSASNFDTTKIPLIPGVQLNVGDALATIKSVNSGRVMLDFNHPLAGKTLTFQIHPIEKIENIEEKIKTVLSLLFQIPKSTIELKLSEKNIQITLGTALPEEVTKKLTEDLQKHIPELKDYKIEYKENTQKPKVTGKSEGFSVPQKTEFSAGSGNILSDLEEKKEAHNHSDPNHKHE